jgi:hypothetical protein
MPDEKENNANKIIWIWSTKPLSYYYIYILKILVTKIMESVLILTLSITIDRVEVSIFNGSSKGLK